MSSRYCKMCGQFHDLDEPWPEACLVQRGQPSIQIIRDIEPYQAMGADVAAGGNAPKIGCRREHREYLQRNDYCERGNDPIRPKKPEYADVSPREIKQTVDRILGRSP